MHFEVENHILVSKLGMYLLLNSGYKFTDSHYPENTITRVIISSYSLPKAVQKKISVSCPAGG